MKRLLGHDPYSGVTEYFTSKAGKCVIESVQDVEPFIEANRKIAEGLDKKEDWWHIGTTPDVINLKWAQESGTKIYSPEWQAYATKQLNLPEYRKFNVNKIKL